MTDRERYTLVQKYLRSGKTVLGNQKAKAEEICEEYGITDKNKKRSAISELELLRVNLVHALALRKKSKKETSEQDKKNMKQARAIANDIFHVGVTKRSKNLGKELATIVQMNLGILEDKELVEEEEGEEEE